MLPQYVGGATVFGVVTNILTDTDELVLRHPAVKRMILDTVQWGEETGRELFAKAVACIDAPSGCVRLRSTRVDPDAATVAPATVDTSPQAHRDSWSCEQTVAVQGRDDHWPRKTFPRARSPRFLCLP